MLKIWYFHGNLCWHEDGKFCLQTHDFLAKNKLRDICHARQSKLSSSTNIISHEKCLICHAKNLHMLFFSKFYFMFREWERPLLFLQQACTPYHYKHFQELDRKILRLTKLSQTLNSWQACHTTKRIVSESLK